MNMVTDNDGITDIRGLEIHRRDEGTSQRNPFQRHLRGDRARGDRATAAVEPGVRRGGRRGSGGRGGGVQAQPPQRDGRSGSDGNDGNPNSSTLTDQINQLKQLIVQLTNELGQVSGRVAWLERQVEALTSNRDHERWGGDDESYDGDPPVGVGGAAGDDRSDGSAPVDAFPSAIGGTANSSSCVVPTAGAGGNMKLKALLQYGKEKLEAHGGFAHVENIIDANGRTSVSRHNDSSLSVIVNGAGVNSKTVNNITCGTNITFNYTSALSESTVKELVRKEMASISK